MNAAPVTAAELGLVSVMVRTLGSLVPIEDGAKPFETDSEAAITSVSLAAARLAPALVVVSAPIGNVLVNDPGATPVTFTVTVHDPLAGMVPPASCTVLPLLAAVTTPPQVVAPPAAAVLVRPAGYVSVNAAPVIAVALELERVRVSTDAAPGATSDGLNDFAIVGWLRTVRVLNAAPDVPAFVVVTLPVELL